MTKHSLVVGKGDVRGIRFQKWAIAPGVRSYRLFVGKECWGHVSRIEGLDYRGWEAFSYFAQENQEENENPALNCVPGFRSRWYAATFIIKHWGYWQNA